MRSTPLEPRVAVIAAGAAVILAGAALATYQILHSLASASLPAAVSISVLAGTFVLAAVVLGGLQLWIRRHVSLRLTPEGLDVATFWGRRQIPWHAVTAVRGNGAAGITIESSMGSVSLAARLFRPRNGLTNALEQYVGARAVELPRLED